MAAEDEETLSHGISERLREWREQAEGAEPCCNCSALSAFLELLDDAEEMQSMLIVWQKWWNEFGFKWYMEAGLIQAEKPPFLQQSSEHFRKWIKQV